MEDITLKNLWKAQDEKLDRTMKLNLYLHLKVTGILFQLHPFSLHLKLLLEIILD